MSQSATVSRKMGMFLGLLLVAVAAIVIAELDSGVAAWFKSQGIGKNPLEYPLIAVALGLLVNAVLRATKTHAVLQPAMRTELFLKVGLILMGARLDITQILSQGIGGLLQAVVMVTSVFFFTWWIGTKLKVNEQLKAVMAAAVSICGVSAAIAAAGAVVAKKKEITYVTALVIMTAIPLMIATPWIAQALGLPADIAGAWFGGNIDTTAAVVGAGTLYGEEAQAVATVVKMSQNALIGVAAFLLALYFVVRIEKKPEEKPSAAMIWHRFPKFVLGFILVSALASLGLFGADIVGTLQALSKWAFAMAFFSIGLELSVRELGKMGWRPLAVYGAATAFNTVLALGVAWLVFGVMGF